MKILALDIARICGFAFGDAGSIPQSGKWELRKTNESPAKEPGALLRNIISLTEGNRPDLIICEGWLDPSMQPNSAVIVNQLLAHGAVMGWAGVMGIPCRQVSPTTARAQVCLRGRAQKLPAAILVGKTKDQIKALQRKETKRMVVETVHLLGLMPRTETDDNIADSLVAFRYAEDVIANTRGQFALMPS